MTLCGMAVRMTGNKVPLVDLTDGMAGGRLKAEPEIVESDVDTDAGVYEQTAKDNRDEVG